MSRKPKRAKPDDPERRAPLYADFPFEFERQLRAADGTLYAVDAADAPEDAREVFDIVIATDTPVPFPGGLLVLSHEDGAIDLTYAQRGLSFLLEHGGEMAPYRIDPDLHVGVVRNVRQLRHQTRGQVEFGPGARAQQTLAEFSADVRPYISAGWLPLANPELLRAGKNGNPDVYVMPRWQLCEASSVSVPADPNAQRIGYSAWGFDFPGTGHGDVASKEEQLMLKKVFDQGGTVIEVEENDPRPALTEMQLRSLGHNGGGNGNGGGAADGDRIAARNKEIAEIVNLCALHGLQARAGEFIEANMSVERVKGQILEIRTTRGDFANGPAAERLVALNKKEAEEYSVVRAVQCALALRGEPGFKFHGLEADVHREIDRIANAERASGGHVMTRGGVFIPMRVRDSVQNDEKLAARVGPGLQTRAVTMGPTVAGGGAELVPNQLLDMIDLLRNRTVCVGLGARMLPGVVGSITWPRRKSDPTVRWMATNPGSGAADSGAGYGWVQSTPKTLIGTVPYPRQLVNLVNFDIESDLRNVLAIGHGLALDLGAIQGTGTDNQPLGIVNNADVQTLAMGNTIPTYKLLRQGLGMILKKNVPGDGVGYATTPEMAAVLSATPRVSGAAAGFIWEGPVENGLIGGYRGMCSNQLPISGSDHELIGGAFGNIVFPLWGAFEVIVDQVTLATSGQIRITTFQMGDVVNQRPEAFVRHTGARLS